MNSRIVVGFCVDKEEDARLLEFLNSKKNKSEFIRSVLYDKLDSNTNKEVNLEYSNSTNKILLDVLGQITMLTNRLLSMEPTSLTTQSPISSFQNNDALYQNEIQNTPPNDNQNTNLNILESTSDNLESYEADGGVFGAVISSLQSL